MTLDEQARLAAESRWQEGNRTCLDAETYRLRLLLQRRVLWLRRLWRHDPLEEYRGMLISDAQADWLLAGEDRQAEARFYREEPQAAEIGRAIVEVEKDLERRARTLTEAGMPLALDVLVHTFGLTSFERNVVVLCLAPELDLSFERLYSYVQDDVTRRYATPHLALTLFAEEGEAGQEARNSFLPESPLRRFLLEILDSDPSPGVVRDARPMRLDGRVTDYLRGVNRLDERVADLLRPVPPGSLSRPYQELVDRLKRSMESVASWGSWTTLNLVGPPGTGKRTVARALCDRLGLRLYSLDAARLPAPGPELRDMLHLTEREAVLSRMALYLDVAGVEPSDKTAIASITDAIERLSGFVVVGSRESWRSEREMVTLRVPKPDAGAQREIWRRELADAADSLNGHLEAITQQFDFGPRTIARAVAAGKAKASLRAADGDTGLTADDLWRACREQAGWHMEELAQRITPGYAWDDIVLPEDVFRQLQEISAQVANRARVYEDWGFGAGLGRGRGIGVLFSGPSGTGKTMAAEILASELELDLYRIDLAGVVSKYIGETEKNLRKVFDAAEQSGAILFFDEADALFGKRSEVKDSHDRYANIEVNYLLQRMEDYRGLAILATNRKSALDSAFMRRLRFVVDFPFPSAEARRDIWWKVFPQETPVDGLDYDSLSRLELAGGNIKNIALNAAFLAANEDAVLDMDHIMRAARREYAKVDKMITEREWGAYYEAVRS
jgi:ATP-dependent 26S proteasome regulatory subunit